ATSPGSFRSSTFCSERIIFHVAARRRSTAFQPATCRRASRRSSRTRFAAGRPAARPKASSEGVGSRAARAVSSWRARGVDHDAGWRALGGARTRRPIMAQHRVVFFFDVDNTLVDNDRVSADMKRYLTREVGAERQARYSEIFEELRKELGYADYLGALQRYRIENPRDPNVLAVSSFLI